MARQRSIPSPGRGVTTVPGLSPAERNTLIETALDLIETLYVHLPLKRSMYAVNPLQRLKLLRRRLEPGPDKPAVKDREFFNEILSIFSQLRDLHTNFVLPEPFRSTTAFLPFRLEKYFEPSDGETFAVSQVTAEHAGHPDFKRGSVVTHWNGTPIARAVAINADREAGSNPAARLAQGLSALTIRWLGQSLLPDEEWVDLRYLPEPGAEPKEIRFAWQVFRREPGAGATAIARAGKNNVWAVGLDARGESERLVRGHLFGRTRGQTPRITRADGAAGGAQEWARDVFPMSGNVQTSAGEFAYVRIATFNVDDEGSYLAEFIRIVSGLSQSGLILDVRGNGGGLISFGERLLQLLTPGKIDPSRFSFLNSVRTQRLTAAHDFIGQWRHSIAQWVETGSEYSQGFSLLPPAAYNDIGQKYQGPVVLVTDALCYSTTDIFAAGFQDHKIGVVLGVDENTGAGGANVWDYSLIAELLGENQRFPLELPQSASFRFAIRRVTRVGDNSGVLLEDLGVKPDELHRITRRDVLERNTDLIEHACRILKTRDVQRLSAKPLASGKVRISYQNLSRIDVYLGDHPLQKSLEVKRSPRLGRMLLSLPRKGTRPPGGELRLEGFRLDRQRRDQLVATTRLTLPPG